MESLRGTRDRNAVNNVSVAVCTIEEILVLVAKCLAGIPKFSLGFQVSCGVACERLCARELHRVSGMLS